MPSPDVKPPPSQPVAVLVVWLGVQCLALACSAGQVPLWLHHPVPRESVALALLTVVQVASSGMLFPLLLAGGRATCVAILATLPFTELAGLLGHQSNLCVLRTFAWVAVWLATLHLTCRVRDVPRLDGLWTCFVTCSTLGGAFFYYLALEAAAAQGATSPPALRFGPLIASACQIRTQSIVGWAYACSPCMPLILKLAIRGWLSGSV